MFEKGSRFGAYRIEGLIGRGGMAEVYLAEHVHLRRSVALKVPSLSTDAEHRARFLRESQLAASIEHPNLVTIYDAGEIGGLLFLAMQFVDGEDLRRLLAREGRPGDVDAAFQTVEQGSARAFVEALATARLAIERALA